jgi:hypothetical protein
MTTSGSPLSREQRLYGALRHAEENSADRGEDGRAAGMREAIRLVAELLPGAVWEWDEIPPGAAVAPPMAHHPPLSDEEYAWVEYLRARPESRPTPEVIALYLSS